MLERGENIEKYDDIVGFDYTDFNEWKNYAKSNILPITKYCLVLLELNKSLRNQLESNFKESFEMENIKKILLGGVNGHGDYMEYSLANIYKMLFGISLNPKEYIALYSNEFDPFEYGYKCNFKDSYFLSFLENLKEITLKILSKLEIEFPILNDIKINKILDDPEEILAVIKELYKCIIKVSANYNYQTFFILNVRNIPRYFIENTYLKFKNYFERIINILDLELKLKPGFIDEKIEWAYSIYGYKENGLAYMLHNLQHFIWNEINSYFIKDIFRLITEPIDLKKKFKEKIQKEFHLTPELNFNTFKLQIGKYNTTLYFVVKSTLIIRRFNNYSPKTKYAYFSSDTSFTILELIKKISPYLFTGSELSVVKRNQIEYSYILNDIKDYDYILRFCLNDFFQPL